MEISEYQTSAKQTDVSKNSLVALLGLAGEIGSLYAVYKKKIRDKIPKDQFRNDLAEELGDVLWYLATLATLNEIDLNEVAEKNISKTSAFFGASESPIFDEDFDKHEQFESHMVVEFELDDKGRSQMYFDGKLLGDPLTDNSHLEDKYRFHDVFHLAFLTHLHWSPVMRALLKKKRKSNPAIDENEDGARAAIIEEAAVAIIFAHAEEADFFPDPRSIPLKLVNLLMKMTSKYEVSACSSAAWRQAVFDGCRAFKAIGDNSGGKVEIDLPSSTLTVE